MVKLAESMNLDIGAIVAKLNGMSPQILVVGGILAGILLLAVSYLISLKIMMEKQF